MSSEEIESMTDAQLDEAVAVEVTQIAERDSDGGLYWRRESVNKHVSPPAYSTDITAAFEVVDTVINQFDDTCGFNIGGMFPGSGDSPAIYAEFLPSIFSSAPSPFRGDAENVQRAICIAALRAVRATSGQQGKERAAAARSAGGEGKASAEASR